MAKHNKKRNVGLLHEQLVRYASEKLVDGERGFAELAIEVLQEHFTDGSELKKEFRLFNALVHTSVEDRAIARQIIKESREACKNHDFTQLRSEKSQLIKDINHKLDPDNFYNKKISKYRVFATVQALLNEWRGSRRLGPEEVVQYEKVLEEWLTRKPTEASMDKSSAANPLALKLMIDRFNAKYNTVLSEEQQSLLENCLHDDEKKLGNQLSEIKSRAKSALQRFYDGCDNQILLEKRDVLEGRIDSLEFDASRQSIVKALTICELVKEMEDEDE